MNYYSYQSFIIIKSMILTDIVTTRLCSNSTLKPQHCSISQANFWELSSVVVRSKPLSNTYWLWSHYWDISKEIHIMNLRSQYLKNNSLNGSP